uniref:C3H1-type domain-containing protein n=1 Tax=viral metagenome TaxID=1070528 RepID=A0A6C0LQX8_9ZZZZ
MYEDYQSEKLYIASNKLQNIYEKRLICFSYLNGDKCQYNKTCTYAHGKEEQIIDSEKKYIYKIILSKNPTEIIENVSENIYKQLMTLTSLCDRCKNKRCTGGYNCRNGSCDFSLKLCKNDLLTGQCINKILEIKVDSVIFSKINDITSPNIYNGCLNGHHITERGLIPYCKHIYQKDNSKKSTYRSVRLVDFNQMNRFIRDDYSDVYDSSDSSDDELENLFKKDEDILFDDFTVE